MLHRFRNVIQTAILIFYYLWFSRVFLKWWAAMHVAFRHCFPAAPSAQISLLRGWAETNAMQTLRQSLWTRNFISISILDIHHIDGLAARRCHGVVDRFYLCRKLAQFRSIAVTVIARCNVLYSPRQHSQLEAPRWSGVMQCMRFSIDSPAMVAACSLIMRMRAERNPS